MRRGMLVVLVGLACGLGLPSTAFANSGTVHGTVSDAVSTQGIADVVVDINVNGVNTAQTTTDASGKFSRVVTWGGASPASVDAGFRPSQAGNHNYLAVSLSGT